MRRARVERTQSHLHPFPKAFVVRQPFSEPLQEAWLVGEGDKLFDEIALSQEDVKNNLVRVSQSPSTSQRRIGEQRRVTTLCHAGRGRTVCMSL